MKCCHSCRGDYRKANKAREWDEKFSEREVAKKTTFCPSCLTDRTWWWFVFLPVDAGEIARYLARGDARRARMAKQKTPVQLED